MLDLRTQKEIETSRKKEVIFALFDRIDNESGHQFSTWRICVQIAKSVDWQTTPHNVYAYIKKSGRCSHLDRTRYTNPIRK